MFNLTKYIFKMKISFLFYFFIKYNSFSFIKIYLLFGIFNMARFLKISISIYKYIDKNI